SGRSEKDTKRTRTERHKRDERIRSAERPGRSSFPPPRETFGSSGGRGRGDDDDNDNYDYDHGYDSNNDDDHEDENHGVGGRGGGGGGGRWQPSPSPGALDDRAAASGKSSSSRHAAPPGRPLSPRRSSGERDRRGVERRSRRPGSTRGSTLSSRAGNSRMRLSAPPTRPPPPVRLPPPVSKRGMGFAVLQRGMSAPFQRGMGTLSAAAARGKGSG
ncbi:unnamed protein product, partial [Laminaria digitata]